MIFFMALRSLKRIYSASCSAAVHAILGDLVLRGLVDLGADLIRIQAPLIGQSVQLNGVYTNGGLAAEKCVSVFGVGEIKCVHVHGDLLSSRGCRGLFILTFCCRVPYCDYSIAYSLNNVNTKTENK